MLTEENAVIVFSTPFSSTTFPARPILTEHVYVYDKDIELDPNKREWIEDCYQKLLELEKQGVIGLLRWDDMTKEEQDRRKEHNIQGYKPYMKIEKEKFPEEYKLLVSFYPELAVED